MKTALYTFFIFFIIAAGIVMVAQPSIPTSTCTENNIPVSTVCLSYIPQNYDADHLTYAGHTRAWAYRLQDRLGLKLSEKQAGYLKKYSSFEDAVNCYFSASGDASLNMTLTPVEFEARYEQIAIEYANR